MLKKIHQCECVYTCFFRWAATHRDMSGKYLEGEGRWSVQRPERAHAIHSTQPCDMDADTWSCIRSPLKLSNITAHPKHQLEPKGLKPNNRVFVYVRKAAWFSCAYSRVEKKKKLQKYERRGSWVIVFSSRNSSVDIYTFVHDVCIGRVVVICHLKRQVMTEAFQGVFCKAKTQAEG